MKKVNVIWVVENYQAIENLLEYGPMDSNFDFEWLLEEGVITKKEFKAVQEEENDEVYQFVLGELRKVFERIPTGCGECGGCYGCSARRMCVKRTVTVGKESWLGAIGAGGGSASGTVEIPEVCAKEIARSLGLTLSEYLEQNA